MNRLSQQAARRLRPAGAFHLPPSAQPIGSSADLIVTDTAAQPEAHITDTRTGQSWRVALVRDESEWRAQIRLPAYPTLLRYHFTFPDGTLLHELRQEEGHTTPVYGRWLEQAFQIAVYDPAGMPPDWTQGMVIYQVFPDRFANGDTATDHLAYGVYGHAPLFKQWGDLPEHPPLGRDFFGGDLRGVIERLPYLRDLGVECLYFTPIFASPTNHRYDANDYLKIDPMLGSEADFDELVAKAEAHNIRLILDAVYNHCSTDSRYFQDALTSKESPYYRWFVFEDYPRTWQGWYGHSHMPEFAECPEMEAFFIGTDGPSGYWSRKGIAGFRTDVTVSNSDGFWQRWRAWLESNHPGMYTVAEEWGNASRYLLGDMFSATMNYRFAWALRGFFAYDKLSPSELDDRLQTWLRDTPEPAQRAQMNLIDSHDTGRAFTACGGERARYRQLIAFQFAYPGAPMLYYGDETGIGGDDAESARRTMPWDALDADLIAWFQRLISLRRQARALRLGSVTTVLLDDAARVYGFARRHESEVVYALFNGGASPASVSILGVEAGTWRDLLGSHADAMVAADGALRVTLAGRGAAWYAR